MRVKNKLVYGIGINDAEYKIAPAVDGRQVTCPFYAVWSGMLGRCYDKSYLKRNPTYSGCTVIEDWLTFSVFRMWMETQDWQAKLVRLFTLRSSQNE